jgi:hypothetical protein
MGQSISACLDPADPAPARVSWTASIEARVAVQSTQIVDILLAAEKPGAALRAQLDGVAATSSWSEYLAGAVLEKLQAAIEAGAPVGTALADALKRALEEAYDFACEHPVLTAILALGVLVILVGPWALEALGFGAEGPILGESIRPPVPMPVD